MSLKIPPDTRMQRAVYFELKVISSPISFLYSFKSHLLVIVGPLMLSQGTRLLSHPGRMCCVSIWKTCRTWVARGFHLPGRGPEQKLAHVGPASRLGAQSRVGAGSQRDPPGEPWACCALGHATHLQGSGLGPHLRAVGWAALTPGRKEGGLRAQTPGEWPGEVPWSCTPPPLAPHST